MKKLTQYVSKKTSALLIVGLALSTGFAGAQTAGFTRDLDLGSRGADVSRLQTLLATDTNVYPQALVTGYFGGL